MAALKPSFFPISSATPFYPTKVLCLQDKQFGLKQVTSVIDISATSLSASDGAEPPSVDLLNSAKAAASLPDSSILLTIQSKSYSLHLEARSGGVSAAEDTWAKKAGAGYLLATLSTSVLALGKWRIGFPADSPHAHSIEMKPVGCGSRAEMFVQDSVPYFWEMRSAPWGAGSDGKKTVAFASSRVCELWKVVEGKRVLVGRFVGRRARDREGVLVVDESGVDIVVAGVTCAALLKRIDSFEGCSMI